MFLSIKDRAALQESLKKSLPTMENSELRAIFTLMIALLSDYEELETARQAEAKNYLCQLRKIEGNLREMAEKITGPSEPETPVWQ